MSKLAPPADVVSKQQLLLQSGNYPPVFYNGDFTPDQLGKYDQEGLIMPLNKLLRQNAPNVLKACKAFPGAPAGLEPARPMYQSETWRCGYQGTPIFSPTSEESKYQIVMRSHYRPQPTALPLVGWPGLSARGVRPHCRGPSRRPAA
jgi:hypothetical protein